jgi:hypothetical protein
VAARSQIHTERGIRPADEECRALVSRILASAEFQRAARLRDFLGYVVDRKLAGAPEEVTEVLIGHRVFGRPASYNPGDDSIVRTEARTLRQRLERYFAGDGAAESFILEIPRGGYLPVFHPRPVLPAPSMEVPAAGWWHVLSRRQWMGAGASALGLTGIAVWARHKMPVAATVAGTAAGQATLHLDSADPRLNVAFQQAKARAMACVFTGDPVGDWYASSKDNICFCSRDTAHESTGAALLGLNRHTLNMLRRFAASVTPQRDWCAYWKITKDGFPTTFNNEDVGGFALPANFDVMRACCRQLLWTGERQYLDPVFTKFYENTVTQYVQLWDPDRSGLMHRRPDRPHVNATYHQEEPHLYTGADLVAAEYAGFMAYAAIQEIKGGRGSLSQRIADDYRRQAAQLRNRFNTEWWDAADNRFWAGMLPDHSWYGAYTADTNVYPLYFGISEDGPKTESLLDIMEQNQPGVVGAFTYYPEVLYRYGRNDAAYRYLMQICDPAFFGYGTSEAAFAAIGALGTGLMGIRPDATQGMVETLPRLPKALEWVRLAQVPVAANRIAVEHRGNGETRFTNQSGVELTWKVAFPAPASGASAGIVMDGAAAAKLSFEHRGSPQPVICAMAPVRPGQSRVAKLVV